MTEHIALYGHYIDITEVDGYIYLTITNAENGAVVCEDVKKELGPNPDRVRRFVRNGAYEVALYGLR